MAVIDSVLEQLAGVKRQNGGFIARCPSHDDHHQSLSLAEGDDGRVLLKCHAGCETADICRSIGIDVAALFPPKEKHGGAEIVDRYSYTDEAGAELFQVVRLAPKSFRQRRRVDGVWQWKLGDVRRVLYRLPKVAEAAAGSGTVYVVEGEKDVHSLERLGVVATTSPGGAAKWQPAYDDALQGAQVIILPDNDDPGRSHAAAVAKGTGGLVVELPGLPEKGDVSDWLAAGATLADLEAAVERARAAGQPKTRTLSAEEARTVCFADIDRRRKGEIVGLPWPMEWPTLQRTIGPIEPGSLTIVAARPSAGKTMFALQLQRHLCEQGYRVLYVSRELTITRLMRRHMAAMGANIYNLRSGQLADCDTKAIDRLIDATQSWKANFDEHSKSVADVLTEVELTKPDCVIIDYLQRLAYDTDREYAAITRIVNDLQDLTIEQDVPLVCLSQLSRPMKGQEHKRPRMSDTRGSGAVEERAANLIMLHRNYSTELDERGQERAQYRQNDGLFLVEKCADGEAGTSVKVQFDGPRMRILETLS